MMRSCATGLLMMGGLAEGMRSFMRAPFIFDHVTSINCDSASTPECVEKCEKSSACQSAFFEVQTWRQCLMDLGKHCKFKPFLYLSTPVQSTTRSCASIATHAVALAIPNTPPLSPSSYTFDSKAHIGARWSVPGDLDECKSATFTVELSKSLWTDFRKCTTDASGSGLEKYENVGMEVFDEEKKLVGVTVHNETGGTVPRKEQLLVRLTIEQPELAYDCLLSNETADHLPEVRFIYQGIERPQMGYDKSQGILRLDERGEFYIGNAPRAWRSY